MIIKCSNCPKFYDDQFRLTICPHNTFSANDGWNNFGYYPASWLADYEPRKTIPVIDKSNNLKIQMSEYDLYQRWLNANKVKTKEIP